VALPVVAAHPLILVVLGVLVVVCLIRVLTNLLRVAAEADDEAAPAAGKVNVEETAVTDVAHLADALNHTFPRHNAI
jgi:hypothetical protein